MIYVRCDHCLKLYYIIDRLTAGSGNLNLFYNDLNANLTLQHVGL